MRTALAGALMALLLALAGCGGDDESERGPASGAEPTTQARSAPAGEVDANAVGVAEGTISTECARASEPERANVAAPVETLLRGLESDPDAPVANGATVFVVVERTARTMENLRCSPAERERLEAALQE